MLRPTATHYAFAASDLDVDFADVCAEALELFEEAEPPTERVPAFGAETRKMPSYELPPEAFRDRA